jgi:oligogalacturonide lyase
MGVGDVLGSEMRTFQNPLAWHRGSFHVRLVRVHPRMFRRPDGRTCVLYTSDHNGYGNVFLAEVPAFEDLPPVPQKDAT